jgi:hypothetical protein
MWIPYTLILAVINAIWGTNTTTPLLDSISAPVQQRLEFEICVEPLSIEPPSDFITSDQWDENIDTLQTHSLLLKKCEPDRVVLYHYAESLNLTSIGRLTIISHSLDSDMFHDVIKSTGNGIASAYLQYIVENYDNLPQYIAFLPAMNATELMPLINFETQDVWFFKPIIEIDEIPVSPDTSCDILWSLLFQSEFGDYNPEAISYTPGHAFMINKDSILQRHLSIYRNWYLRINDANLVYADKVDIVFEHTWHRMFR